MRNQRRRGRGAAVRCVLGVAGVTVATANAAAQTQDVLAQAQDVLAPVVVTATRDEARGFDLPASIDAVGADVLQKGQLQINLSESLGRVPGIVVQNRQNYAQDLQISSRGFGARSTFGVRGLRLYADGIPATMPDGQGQVSHFALGSAKRVEVLRGPFSVLYGNSSGGVVQILTEDGAKEPYIQPSAAFGSFGTRRFGLKASGAASPLDYVVEASRFNTDGYRDHSAARRDAASAKLKVAVGPATSLTILANYLDTPEAQDPLGLTRAQFNANPRSVDPVAIQFDTRKSVSQTQGGLALEHRLTTTQSLRLMGYTGKRDVLQFLAIPTATQLASQLHPGGVVDLDRSYHGLDLRWAFKDRLAGGPFSLTAGMNYEALDEDRRGYLNFVGAQLGVQGALRRNENNKVSNFDQYAQAEWGFAPRWSGQLGVRHSVVRFKSKDNYIVGTNPDDSGAVRYSRTTPVGGLVFNLTDAINLYGAVGSGFETPTFNELAYRASGGTGLNFALRPARSVNVELGTKMLLGRNAQFNAALFQTRTKDEIVVLTNSGGRSTFQNVGRTRRQGVEASFVAEVLPNVTVLISAATLRATYDEDFFTCTTAPCITPNVRIPAGTRLPGVPSKTGFAELAWRQPWFTTAFEVRAADRVFVNDQNSDAAGGYAVASWRFVLEQRVARWTFNEFVRVDNLFDRKYSGSVIVNEGNARFFEPAPGRNYLVGVSAQYRF